MNTATRTVAAFAAAAVLTITATPAIAADPNVPPNCTVDCVADPVVPDAPVCITAAEAVQVSDYLTGPGGIVGGVQRAETELAVRAATIHAQAETITAQAATITAQQTRLDRQRATIVRLRAKLAASR